jgi:aspartate kinase
MEGVLVSGATIQKDMAKIGLIGIGNEPGNAAKVFAQLAQARVVVNDIVQTEVSKAKANLSFTVNISDLDPAKNVAEQIKGELNCDDIFVREDIAEVSVVAVSLKKHYGERNQDQLYCGRQSGPEGSNGCM